MKSNLSKLVLSSFMLGALVTPAFADAQSDRQAKMKTVGKSMGIVGKMAKGQTDFDGTAALAAFVAMKEAAVSFEEMFPDGTETGGETEASPKIFSDRAGFEKTHADFEADLEKAATSAPADLAVLQATVGMVGENCGVCHKAYRVKKD